MSDKVWITAKSELIPFEKMADKHLQNAIEWCDLRTQSMARKPRSGDIRINKAHDRELARVGDLKFDLVAEQCARAQVKAKADMERKKNAEAKGALYPVGTWFTIVADKSGTVNGTYVPQGTAFRYYLAQGRDLALHQ